jgi:hypothetical protein
VGRAAHPPQPVDGCLAWAPAVLAGGGAAAPLRPQLNPVEALWASRKGVELADLAGESLEEVGAAAERGIQRIRGITTWPTRSFGAAACRYGERQPCRRNANLLRVKRK